MQRQHSPNETPEQEDSSGEARDQSKTDAPTFRIDWVYFALGAAVLLLLAGAVVMGSMLTGKAMWSADPGIPAESRMWGHIIESSTIGVMLAFSGLLVGLAAQVCGYVRSCRDYGIEAGRKQQVAVMEELDLAREVHASDSAVRTGQLETVVERLDAIAEELALARAERVKDLVGVRNEVQRLREHVMTPKPHRGPGQRGGKPRRPRPTDGIVMDAELRGFLAAQKDNPPDWQQQS